MSMRAQAAAVAEPAGIDYIFMNSGAVLYVPPNRVIAIIPLTADPVVCMWFPWFDKTAMPNGLAKVWSVENEARLKSLVDKKLKPWVVMAPLFDAWCQAAK
jgi:hypothetical protein